MPGILKPRKDNPNRSKTVRRKMQGEERALRAREPNVLSETTEALPEAAASFATAPEKPSGDISAENTVKKIQDGMIVEQTVFYNPGKGKPIVHARFRLTTAARGKKKQDNLQIAAYLLRFEVLDASEGIVVESLILGPWQLTGLVLETGAIYIAEPLWAGFQSIQVESKGRIHLGDTLRNRMLDLPVKVSVVIPGPEVFTI